MYSCISVTAASMKRQERSRSNEKERAVSIKMFQRQKILYCDP
jgi:hypothetical protein